MVAIIDCTMRSEKCSLVVRRKFKAHIFTYPTAYVPGFKYYSDTTGLLWQSPGYKFKATIEDLAASGVQLHLHQLEVNYKKHKKENTN